jgi:hypothetical protein
VDVGTGIAALGPSPILLKLLGPTADYVGEGVKSWAEHRVQNVQQIFNKAEHKIDQAELDAPGGVPPRVLKGILDDGSFVDDDLGQEYLAGVLASSRSGTSRDDRGAAHIDELNRLSTYQLRSHYIAYRELQNICANRSDLQLGISRERESIGNVFLSSRDYIVAMDFSADEVENLNAIFPHVFGGLVREDLIGETTAWGDDDHLRSSVSNREFPGKHGLVFEMTLFGIELFCAAHGIMRHPLAAFVGPSATFDSRMGTEVPRASLYRVDDLPVFEPPEAEAADTGGQSGSVK